MLFFVKFILFTIYSHCFAHCVYSFIQKNEKILLFLRFFVDKRGEILLNLAHSYVRQQKIGYAKVAQLVEQLICNQPVVGSIPIFGST